MWKPLQWIVNLFRRERAKLRAALLPFALAVAEDLFKKDFDRNGVVADARIELSRLIRSATPEIARGIFRSYLNTDGSIKSDVIEILPLEVLKKVLGIAKLVTLLSVQGWPVSIQTILKMGYSILDTAVQDAYEERVKPKPTT